MNTQRTTPDHDINYWIFPGLKPNALDIKLMRIMSAVTYFYEVDKDSIRRKGRKGNLVKCRHIFYYFARKYTRHSLADIGIWSSIGWTADHSTVLHGCRKVEEFLTWDKAYIKEIKKINELILSKGQPDGNRN